MKMIPKKEKQDHRNQIGSLLHFYKSSCIFSRSFKTEIRVKSFLLVTGSPSVIKALFFNQLLFKKTKFCLPNLISCWQIAQGIYFYQIAKSL